MIDIGGEDTACDIRESSAQICRADTIGEVAEVAQDGLDRIGSDASLCFAFLRHTGLRL